jgi:hypothetical protein
VKLSIFYFNYFAWFNLLRTPNSTEMNKFLKCLMDCEFLLSFLIQISKSSNVFNNKFNENNNMESKTTTSGKTTTVQNRPTSLNHCKALVPDKIMDYFHDFSTRCENFKAFSSHSFQSRKSKKSSSYYKNLLEIFDKLTKCDQESSTKLLKTLRTFIGKKKFKNMKKLLLGSKEISFEQNCDEIVTCTTTLNNNEVKLKKLRRKSELEILRENILNNLDFSNGKLLRKRKSKKIFYNPFSTLALVCKKSQKLTLTRQNIDKERDENKSREEENNKKYQNHEIFESLERNLSSKPLDIMALNFPLNKFDQLFDETIKEIIFEAQKQDNKPKLSEEKFKNSDIAMTQDSQVCLNFANQSLEQLTNHYRTDVELDFENTSPENDFELPDNTMMVTNLQKFNENSNKILFVDVDQNTEQDEMFGFANEVDSLQFDSCVAPNNQVQVPSLGNTSNCSSISETEVLCSEHLLEEKFTTKLPKFSISFKTFFSSPTTNSLSSILLQNEPCQSSKQSSYLSVGSVRSTENSISYQNVEPENLTSFPQNAAKFLTTSDYRLKVTNRSEINQLRPWLPWNTNKDNKNKKSVEFMLRPECICAAYKCMGSTCTFYTNDLLLFSFHLKMHESNLEQDSLNFKRCAYCAYLTTENRRLIMHLQTIHNDDNYFCMNCFYRNSEEENLANHLKCFHGFPSINSLQ